MLATLNSPYPIYPSFGWESGTPIDRYFIEKFLQKHRSAIRGRVLEIGDREYTVKFGGEHVDQSDVLSAAADGDAGVIVADITSVPSIGDRTYDCIILTQTLHYVRDMNAAVGELHRILKPGGSLLITVPGISQISAWDMERWGDRWRLSTLALEETLASAFDPKNIEVSSLGNAASAVAFIQGIPTEQVPKKVLEAANPEYQILVAAQARRSPR